MPSKEKLMSNLLKFRASVLEKEPTLEEQRQALSWMISLREVTLKDKPKKVTKRKTFGPSPLLALMKLAKDKKKLT